MENVKNKKEYIYNILVIIILSVVTGYFLFRGENKEDIISAIISIKPSYLIIGIILAFGFILGEAISIKILLRIFNHDLTLIETLKYSFIGFLFSSITPSSSGGQPMQIYQMKKDGIEVYKSSLVLLIELMVYQVVTVLYGVVAFVWAYDTSLMENKYTYVFIVIGIVINLISVIFIALSIFNENISNQLLKLISYIILKLPIKKSKKDKLISSIKYQIKEYNNCAKYIKCNLYSLFKVLFVTIFQVGAFFSVSYIIYRALGNSQRSFIEILLIQTLAYISSSYMPLPGAIGVSESNFLSIYKKIYSSKILTGALVLNRGITFYVLLLISIIALLLYKLSNVKLKYLSSQ